MAVRDLLLSAHSCGLKSNAIEVTTQKVLTAGIAVESMHRPAAQHAAPHLAINPNTAPRYNQHERSQHRWDRQLEERRTASGFPQRLWRNWRRGIVLRARQRWA